MFGEDSMTKQRAFFKKTQNEFGGSLNQGKRKEARILDTRKPIHFVLKSQKSANLYLRRVELQKLLYRYAKKFGIKVYKESVQRDHWHFCIKITNRHLYRAFIRALTGTIARKIGKGLWSQTPYSRIVTWGRDFLNVLDYVLLNQCEAAYIVPYAIRKKPRTCRQ
jgi:REP element-mobilizing transposase RayT